MLRAVIFDFNGVILDDEPMHFRSMQKAVARLGIILTKEEYWDRYLPLDDARALQAICEAHSVTLENPQREQLLELVSQAYEDELLAGYPLFPGAGRLVRDAAARLPLAIASGARRREIEDALQATGLRPCFRAIVAAEDFPVGKPRPESFLFALETLNGIAAAGGPPIRPAEILVIEDAIACVEGVRAAGMKCLAVSSTYPAASLAGADFVVTSLADIDTDFLFSLFEEQP